MKRFAWTDERIDDLSRRMDIGFKRVDSDMGELKSEMRAGFADLRGEVSALRSLMYGFGGGPHRQSRGSHPPARHLNAGPCLSVRGDAMIVAWTPPLSPND